MIKSKAVKNSFWLIIEKFISIFGLVFVTSFVAKYIGPESFGKINFYSSIFVVFVTVSTWGIDVISTKRLSRNVFSGVRLLHSLKYIRLIILTFLSVPLLFYVYTFTDRLSFIFTLSLFIANVFVVQDIYTYYNDSTYQSFYNVVSNVIGVIFGLALRFVIAYLKLSPEYLSLAIVTVSLVPFLIRYFVFNARYLKEKTPAKFRHQKRYISYVMYTGASLVVSAVSVTLYINISSLLLGSLVSKEALGIYAVAATIGGAWSFVNIAVLKSFTPMLYSSKDSSEINSKCSALAWVMIFFGGGYWFFYFLCGDFLIKLLYGRDYYSAYYVGCFIVITKRLSNLGQL